MANSSAPPASSNPPSTAAFASGKPALVNVLTDPDIVYPRKRNSA
jgi:acetolactate synthase I/II/III large subunit